MFRIGAKNTQLLTEVELTLSKKHEVPRKNIETTSRRLKKGVELRIKSTQKPHFSYTKTGDSLSQAVKKLHHELH